MHCSDPCCNSGTWVVPETLVAYNFDSKWIIAKTDSTYYNNSEDFAYWIFNKDFSIPTKDLKDSINAHLIGPVDSVTFYKLLSEKGIRLQLKDYLK